MKNFLVLFFIFFALKISVFGQENYNLVQEGIQLLEAEKFGEAEAAFKKVIAKTDTLKEAHFNLGNAVYRQGRFDEARQNYENALALFSNKKERAEVYHNIGNTFMAEKKWEESITSFKNALKNNASDMDTKYNLAFAQEMLKKQQQEKQQEQKNEEEKKDEQKDKQAEEQEKDEQKDKGDQDEKKEDENKDAKQDEKDADQEKNEDSENGEQKESEGEPKPQKLTKEEAERMLRAIESQEQKLQDKKKQEEMTPVRINTDKDW